MPSYISPESYGAWIVARNTANDENQEWENQNRFVRGGRKPFVTFDYARDLERDLKSARFRLSEESIIRGFFIIQGMYDLLQTKTMKKLRDSGLDDEAGRMNNTMKCKIQETAGSPTVKIFEYSSSGHLWKLQSAQCQRRERAHEDSILRELLSVLIHNQVLLSVTHCYKAPSPEAQKDKKPNPYTATFKIKLDGTDEEMYIWMRELCQYRLSGAVPYLTAAYGTLADIVEQNEAFALRKKVTQREKIFQYRFHRCDPPTYRRDDESLQRLLVNLSTGCADAKKVNSWELLLLDKPQGL